MSGENVTRDSVREKLTRYLLNADHPLGTGKAKFFERALGFTQVSATELAEQLIFDPALARHGEESVFGTKYRQTINVTGVNGRSIFVDTIWIWNLDGSVRPVTAFSQN